MLLCPLAKLVATRVRLRPARTLTLQEARRTCLLHRLSLLIQPATVTGCTPSFLAASATVTRPAFIFSTHSSATARGTRLCLYGNLARSLETVPWIACSEKPIRFEISDIGLRPRHRRSSSSSSFGVIPLRQGNRRLSIRAAFSIVDSLYPISFAMTLTGTRSFQRRSIFSSSSIVTCPP